MKKRNKLMLAMLLPLLAATPTSVRAQLMPSTPTSQMERLTRGVVAMPGSSGLFVSWRLLGSDAANTTFDLLDGERVVARNLAVSNYNDAGGKASSQYRVVTRVDGVAADTSEVCTPWNDIYKHIQLDRPTGGSDYSYFPHDCSAADVDGDGADEIMYGSAAIDNDGSLLYSTGLGHGDAQHLGDLIPSRPGLEYFMVHESSPYGLSVRDAATGEILIHFTGSGDTGRGMAADINADHHGHEFWSSDTYNVYNAEGKVISSERGQRPRYCFRIYWDGDALDELLDGVTINKGTNRLLNLDRYGASASYGTKANPDLQADLFGDWREEVILFSKEDSASINIFSTNTPTQLAVPTLMHDHQYRMSIAWQNTGYNQPPHLGYSLIDYVSPRFAVEEGSLREQTVLLGEPMRDVVCRYVNCTSVTLYQTWLNGEHIKSYLAPEGFSFTRNSVAQTVTLSGTPTEAGDYTFILRSLGGPSGYASTDTLRLHVVSDATAIAGIAATAKDSKESVFSLQGVRMRACGTPLPKGVYVSRGRKFVVK